MTDAGPLGFTSPRVQRLRRLLGRRRDREEDGHFVVEGPMLVAEAVAAGWSVDEQYVAPGVEPMTDAGTVHRLAPGVAQRVSDTVSPSGLLAVVAMPRRLASPLTASQLVVVADRVSDPGNLGTILRSADAAGFDAVITTPGTVDVYNPKVVRSSAGALFHVPVAVATLAELAGAGFRVVGTSSHRGVPHTRADWTGRVAIVAGGEVAGLECDAPVHEWVRIEQHGRAESLNVAMAVTVLCFEAARARAAEPRS